MSYSVRLKQMGALIRAPGARISATAFSSSSRAVSADGTPKHQRLGRQPVMLPINPYPCRLEMQSMVEPRSEIMTPEVERLVS